jgi:hypothetical protein
MLVLSAFVAAQLLAYFLANSPWIPVARRTRSQFKVVLIRLQHVYTPHERAIITNELYMRSVAGLQRVRRDDLLLSPPLMLL